MRLNYMVAPTEIENYGLLEMEKIYQVKMETADFAHDEGLSLKKVPAGTEIVILLAVVRRWWTFLSLRISLNLLHRYSPLRRFLSWMLPRNLH